MSSGVIILRVGTSSHPSADNISIWSFNTPFPTKSSNKYDAISLADLNQNPQTPEPPNFLCDLNQNLQTPKPHNSQLNTKTRLPPEQSFKCKDGALKPSTREGLPKKACRF
jgi:hypothetical protein